jgi:hypothetical protein
MNKKLLTGIIIVLVVALTIFASIPMGVLAIPAWIYLVLKVRKRKTSIFHDQMEPILAEMRLKRLKTFLIVAGLSFPVFIVGAIVHNVLHGLSEIEVTVSLIIALVALWVFILATANGLHIFLKGRQKTI